MARNDHSLLASVNHGHPAIAATPRPGVFKGEGVVGAHGAAVNGNRANVNAERQMDRPPSARTNNSYNSDGNRPNNADRPQTHPENAHNNQGNQNHNEQNNAHNNNNNRPNTQQSHENHPNENRPNEHDSHRER
jgi:hypothetical protein